MSVETPKFDTPNGGGELGQMQTNVSDAIGRLDAALEKELILTEQMHEIFNGDAFRHAIANVVTEMFSGEGAPLMQTAIFNYLNGGEQSPLQTAIAAYFSGSENGEEGTIPLETVFATYYNKYLNGDGKDIVGLIPSSQQAIQEVQTIYEQAIHGGGDENAGMVGLLPTKYTAIDEIDQKKRESISQIETAGKTVLSNIQDAVRRTVDNMIGHIARMVAGIIGVPASSSSTGRGGPSEHYTPGNR